MQKRILLSSIFIILVLTGLAVAHPLGNFSINQYSRLEVEKSQIKVRQIIDMAEIPTFQATGEIDANKDGMLSSTELEAYTDKITPAYLADLRLSINDSPIALRALSSKTGAPVTSGNLPTLRIEWELVGEFPVTDAASVNRIYFENKNYAERIGWSEIVVSRAGGINVFDSSAFADNLSDELKTYPRDMLTAPLREKSATFSFTTGEVPAKAVGLQNRDGHASAAVQKDKFAELINVPEITPSIILFGLLLAFGLGAAHAMSPGHGKTVVGAYLVGTRGTFKHAVFLGMTVTVTHTLGVFALGLITLFASSYILPERLMPFLNFVSGLLVLFIGLTLFKERLFSAFDSKKSLRHHHHHEHAHDSGEPHIHNGFTHTHNGSTHSHLPPTEVSWQSLLSLGISGGLLPCPSALVLMLSAISLGRIGYGLLLTLVFSFGLAATLTSVGLIFLYVGRIFDRPSLSKNPIIKSLPVVSALVISCLGAVICYNSFR